MNMHLMAGALLTAATMAPAHLGPITKPSAGQILAPGTTVAVTWSVSTAHNNQDLAYSTDGATWTQIAANLGRSANSYNWTVPATASTTVRLRVCQKENQGGTVAGCTNSENTQNLTSGKTVPGGKVYAAISGNFIIQAASAAKGAIASESGARIRLDAASRSVEAAFTLERAGTVRLQAFDTRGRLLATLLDEVRAEGFHRLSVFSNALAAGQVAMFRLEAGGKAMLQPAEPGR